MILLCLSDTNDSRPADAKSYSKIHKLDHCFTVVRVIPKRYIPLTQVNTTKMIKFNCLPKEQISIKKIETLTTRTPSIYALTASKLTTS